MKKMVTIQARVTEDRHPELVEWWCDGKGDKSATVRIALEWWLGMSQKIENMESMLEMLADREMNRMQF